MSTFLLYIQYRQNAEQIREDDKKLRDTVMLAIAPTEAPERSYRSQKAPVETPTEAPTGFTHFNYSAEKQRIREEMQLEQRIAEAQNLYDDQSEGYENDLV